VIKILGVLLLALCLAVPATACKVEAPPDGLEITAESVSVDFPASIVFDIAVTSDVDISDVRLHYRVDKMSFADVVSEIKVEFTPSRKVEAEWVWDARKTGGVPPGALMEYWWTVTDAGGRQASSDMKTVQIDDGRYDWKSISEGRVTLYWYHGGDVFGEELMAAIQGILEHIEEYAGAVLEQVVKLYIYASSADLRGAMVFPQEWTGGVAYSQYGTIAIGISPENLEWGKRAVAHELTHLVIHQVTQNPYGDLPTWLDEGLAMNSEGELEEHFAMLLESARQNDRLISVRSLCSPFSAFVEESALGYAQSYSIVEFLRENYGREKLSELLKVFARGSGYDEALLEVYGYDMDELDRLWREYLETGALPAGTLAGVAPAP
jgi:hypothetical protein